VPPEIVEYKKKKKKKKEEAKALVLNCIWIPESRQSRLWGSGGMSPENSRMSCLLFPEKETKRVG
jgi:hypothetical protein